MHTEVEVKFLEVDSKKLEARLRKLGAEKIFDAVMKEMKFKPLVPPIGVIRVRQEGDACFFVIKERVSKGLSLTSSEFSVKVDDFDRMVEMIFKLGYRKKEFYEKHRRSFMLGDVRIEFDKMVGEYAFVPEFMEIEGRDEAAVKKAIDLLGLSQAVAKNWTAGKVCRYYKKRLA